VGSYGGEVRGVSKRAKSQELRTDHFAVEKTSLRVLPGVVVSCGGFLVIVGLIPVCLPVSSGGWGPKTGYFDWKNVVKTWWFVW
jgi:hypothetical protein